MRLGVLGGTFDPVHVGHLALARSAREELGLERVVFVPAGQPWRKAGRRIASAEHRLAMLRLALEGESRFDVLTLELKRSGPSYTVDTLEALRDERPDDDLFFLLGEDALADMPNWVRPERILELVRLAVARRSDSRGEMSEQGEGQLPGLTERIVWLKMPLVAVSATEIRDRVRAGLSVDEMVPPGVAGYIREHDLYKT